MRLSYTLGRSLYLPLTSHCSTSLTLPETRGPNFLLPSYVVASLCRVRDAERGEARWKHWCLWLDMQEGGQLLPARVTEPAVEATGRPTVEELLQEVASHNEPYDAIVIAGEGEPTLRLDALYELMERRLVVGEPQQHTVRLTTNGLVTDPTVPQALKDRGLTSVSVGLHTNDPDLYQQLLQPTVPDAHATVCRFVERSIQAGLEVECTAVDRPEVDRAATEALAAQLTHHHPLRWRTYFP